MKLRMSNLAVNPLHQISQRTDGNLAFRFGTEASVATARAAWFERLQIHPKQVALLAGQHHHQLGTVPPEWLGRGIFTQLDEYPDLDAVLLEPGQLGMMLLADCLGLVIWSIDTPVVALVHAGYRGVAADLPVQAAITLTDKYQLAPESLRVWCSPALLAEHSVFDEGIYERFPATWREPYLTASGDLTYPWRLDWVKAALERLQSQAGIPKGAISTPLADTFTDARYFSHARTARLGDRPEGRHAILAGFLCD